MYRRRKSKDLKKSLEKLLFDKAELEKKLEQFENQKTLEVKVQLKELVESYNGVNLLIAKADVANADQLKNLSFQLKNEIPRLICVLGANLNQKPMLSVILDEALLKETGLHAGNMVKDLAKDIQGGGGGQPFYATAGGTNLSGLDVSLNRAKELIKW